MLRNSSRVIVLKVKVEAKAEMKKVRSSLNLDLDLSLPRSAILRVDLLIPRRADH
jgi:hypothetical protein